MNDFQKYVSQNKDRAKAVGPGVYRIPLVQEELTPSFKLNSPYMQGAENGGLYAFVDSTGNIIPNQDIEYDSSDNQYYKVTHLPDTKVEAPSLSAYNDPNYTNILTGNYYGHKFVPTEQNVKYYQKLYEKDHKVREGWGPHRWGQLGGIMGAGAALAAIGAYAPTIAGWTYRTALPWVAENLAVPTIVAGSVDLAQNALFGTTSSETVSNFLQDNLHVPQPIADIAGEATNPGWYVPSSYGVKLWNGAVNTAKNAKNLYYGFQHGDIYKISTNPLLKQILDSPITERFLTKTQPGKRALETIMRTTSAPNPIPETLQGMQKLPWKPRINYILFGKNPKLRRLFGQPNMHYGDNSWSSSTIIPYTIDGGEFGSIDAPITVGGNVYAGLVDNTGNIVIGKGYGDIIDAYLYGTTIDPKIATLSTNNAGRQFFDNYILRNYPNKNIKSYTVKGDVDPKTIMKTSKWEGRSDTFAEEFRTNDNKAAINVAGHNYQSGWTDPSSRFPQVQRGFDIWKFNPEEYHNKWDVGNNYLESRGLELVDKAGTPIIFEQPWKLIAQ